MSCENCIHSTVCNDLSSHVNEGTCEHFDEDTTQAQHDQYLRLAAEYDNFRKRTRQELDQTYMRAKTDIVSQLLPILDSIDMAIKYESNSDNITGIKMIQTQCNEILTSLGVEEVLSEGQEFNPEHHECIQHIDDETYSQNTIVQVIQKGYKINNKIIRYPKVVVAN